jgi:hypothetical protein
VADRIYIRAWKKDKNTAVADREIVYVRAEKALYVGTGDGTAKIGGAFYAEHGVTTGEEINKAYQTGETVACKLNDGRVLYLVRDWGTGKGFTFSSTDYTNVTSVEVNGSSWTEPVTYKFAIATE